MKNLSTTIISSIGSNTNTVLEIDSALSNNFSSEEIDIPSSIIEIPIQSFNSQSIILNDSDCSDLFFDQVCRKLREDGLFFSTTSHNEGINKDSSIVITLDQQYSSGDDSLIFAPYYNGRLGQADSLTLSMHFAFQQGGLSTNKIMPGKVGFWEDSNGHVRHISPTETEKNIDVDLDTSFVTISLGTRSNNPQLVAKCIENGLIRYAYYLDHFDIHSDLLYRTSDGESVKTVSDYFNSSVHDLYHFNHLEDMETLKEQVVINPIVQDMDVFHLDFDVPLENAIHKAH